MRLILGHTGAVLGLAYAPGGTRLTSASHDGTARVWDVPTGRELAKVRTAENHAFAVAVHPTEPVFAAGFGTQMGLAVIRPLEPMDGLAEPPFLGPDFCCRWLAFAPDGSTIAFGGSDPTVYGRYTHSLPIMRIIQRRIAGSPLYAGDFSPGAQLSGHAWLLAVLAHSPAVIHVFPFSVVNQPIHETEWLLREIRPLRRGGRGHALKWSPDGRHIAAAIDDQLAVIDRQTWEPRRIRKAHAGTILTLAFTPDGTLVSGGADGYVIAWDVETGQRKAVYAWQIGEIRAVAAAPDGLTLAAGGGHGEILLWDRAAW